MNTVQRIAKNTLYLGFADIITRILSLILIIFIARHLQDTGFGIYSFVFAFTSFFAVVSDLGLSTLTVREVARNKELAGKFIGNILFVKILLSLISFSLLFIVISLMNYPNVTTLAVYIAGATVFMNSFTLLFISLFRAFERMEYEAVVLVGERVIVISLVLFLIYLGYGLIEIVSASLFSSIFSFVFSGAIVFRHFTKPKFEFDISFLRSSLKNAIPFGLTTIFVTIYFQIDIVMLSLMQGDAVVGWYNAAYKIIFGLLFIPSAFVGSLFPVLSKYSLYSEHSLNKTFRIGFKYLFVVALPITLTGFMFSDKIILFLYASGYTQSITAFKVLIFVIPVIFSTILFGNTLQAIDKQHIVSYVAGLNALFNIILNYLLIPKYSYIGASVATVLTEGLGLFMMFYYLHKSSIKVSTYESVLKPLFAGSFFIIFIYYFEQIDLHLLVILGIGLYFIILSLTKTISKEDAKMFRSIFSYGTTLLRGI